MTQVRIEKTVINVYPPSNGNKIVVVRDRVKIVTVGTQGLPGAAGLDGGSDYIYVAGENISALKACYYNPSNNKIFKASNLDTNQSNRFVGISLDSGVTDQNVRIKREGILEDSNWTWNTSISPNLYLSTDGTIVQSAPTSGARLKIGFVLSATKIFINATESIILI